MSGPAARCRAGAPVTAIAAIDVGSNCRAATCGFDLNPVAANDRARVLSNTLDALQLRGHGVPEPGTLALDALALPDLAVTRRRAKADAT